MPNSYVFVWENNMYGNKRVNGHTWPGHSSMNIGEEFDGPRDEYLLGGNKCFVSWFPSEGSNFGLKTLFAKKQRGTALPSFVNDVNAEEYYPDHVIRLACSDESIRNMQAAWWQILLKPSGASYKAFRKNCSTIVSRVLHAGGFYAHKWALDNNLVWAPVDITKLAMAAGGVQMQWDDFLDNVLVGPSDDADPRNYNLETERGREINCARDAVFCSTGAPCRFDNGQMVL